MLPDTPSSLPPIPGMTSLMRSSLASLSSLRLSRRAMDEDVVSVASRATTRTGVGVADLAVFGLKRS